MKICRGEIYLADLSPSRGSEQGGVRPVLIIQNNVGNKYSTTVIVASITSRDKKAMVPTHVHIKASLDGLLMDSRIMLEQIRTIDKVRLQNKLGQITDEELEKVNRALAISIDLNYQPKAM